MIFELIATLVLLSLLVALAIVDVQSQRLPDAVTLPLIGVGLAVNSFALTTPWSALAGSLLGYGSFVALELGYRHLRGVDALGRGDAKLFAAGGAWCTAWYLPYIALIAAITGLVYAIGLQLLRGRSVERMTTIAFGPWLALGIAVIWTLRIYMSGILFNI